jgi:PAS domain S-box-containing protein
MARVDTSRSLASAVITDPQRLAALESTGLLDSLPEENFDRLTRFACRDLHTPVALLSLANDQRQFFKSAQGLAEPLGSLRETPLSDSLCEHVVSSGLPVVIADARQHPLGHVSREVRDLHLVAYLGVPLITSDQQSLGSFCVADFEARDWRTDEIETLSALAATAMREIVLHNVTMEINHRGANQQRRPSLVQFVTEERLRLVLSAVHAGVWDWDVVNDRQVWSPEMYDLFGSDEALTLSTADLITRFIHPDDRSLVQSAYTNLMAGGERVRQFDVEYRIIRPDGATVWVSSIGHVEKDGSGRPIRVLGITRDVSARKRAEQTQQESAHFIRKMAALSPNFIGVFDLDDKHPIYRNRSLSEVLGYGNAADENPIAIIDGVMHPEDRERMDAFKRSLQDLEDQATAELECRYRRADGGWGWFLLRHAVFARKPDGRARQVVGTMTEITALKHAENELRRLNVELEQRVAARTAELSLANSELESFAYSVSHDLRAPLRAITGFCRMLLEHCGAQLDAEGQRCLGRVNTAAQRMSELIDALLTLSRVTRGQLSRERVNMSVLVRTIATELALSEPDRDVDIVIAEHVTAPGDPTLLRIALENLLGNAWKFTSRHEQARIEFGAQHCQHGPIFFVRDNGVGFDMKHSAQLFTPFQRLHTTEEFPGTGIGLATVRRIIARHDGRIWAESTRGSGATFYFTLSGASCPQS